MSVNGVNGITNGVNGNHSTDEANTASKTSAVKEASTVNGIHRINGGKTINQTNNPNGTGRYVRKKYKPGQVNGASTANGSPSNVDGTTFPTTIMPTPTAPAPSPSDAASIAKRAFIFFLPYPVPPSTLLPYTLLLPDHNPLGIPTRLWEPTRTLHLTSPGGTYLRIQIFRDPRGPEFDHVQPNTGGPLWSLEWAHGGQETRHWMEDPHKDEEPEGRSELMQCARWTHWVDSKIMVEEREVVDDGAAYPMGETAPQGESEFVVAQGYSPLFSHGLATECLFLKVPIVATHPHTSKLSVVLRAEAPAHKVRGLIVRVGQHCQGIVKKGDYTSVERWEYVENQELGGDENGDRIVGGWKRIAKVGQQFIPCAVAFRPEILEVGIKIAYYDYEWAVEEVVEWRD